MAAWAGPSSCSAFVCQFLCVSGCDSKKKTAVVKRKVAALDERQKVSQKEVPPLFRDVTRESGIDFIHVTGREGTYFFPEIMVGGAHSWTSTMTETWISI